MTESTRNGKSDQGPVRLAIILAPGTMTHMGRTIGHLAVGLLDEPMRLTVIAPDGEDVSALPSPPVEVMTYPRGRFGQPPGRAIESLASHLSRRRVEFLHCLDGRAHGLTRKLSEAGHWPYFLSVLSLRQCRQRVPPGEHCCGIIAASLPLREAALAERAAPAANVHLVRPGLRTATTLSCFSRPSGSRAIVAAGALNDYEAFNEVLNSFAALRGLDYDCMLFIMGNGRAEMRLRERVQSMKLTHDVTFVDRLDQDRLPGLFGAADVMVYPRSDGRLETEILEAMAAGVAVVVGEPMVCDSVIDGQTVISYGTDPDDLTAKLRALLDDPDAATQLAGRGREYVRQRHSPIDMVASLAELYRHNALRGQPLKAL